MNVTFLSRVFNMKKNIQYAEMTREGASVPIGQGAGKNRQVFLKCGCVTEPLLYVASPFISSQG